MSSTSDQEVEAACPCCGEPVRGQPRRAPAAHRVLVGDCRSPDDVARLLGGAKVAVAFTSPPYASQREYDQASGFQPIPPNEYVDWFEAVQANVAVCLERLSNMGLTPRLVATPEATA